MTGYELLRNHIELMIWLTVLEDDLRNNDLEDRFPLDVLFYHVVSQVKVSVNHSIGYLQQELKIPDDEILSRIQDQVAHVSAFANAASKKLDEDPELLNRRLDEIRRQMK